MLVEIQEMSKQFTVDQIALSSITAAIGEGEMVGVVGPDGAGKTTLLRLIAGLLKPTTGSVKIQGRDVIEESAFVRRHIGYMPQKFGLYEDLTVEENFQLYADLHGLSTERRQSRFEELSHITQLAPFGDRLAGNLSGGMKQKLGIACALLGDPLLLLLDEASVGVDPISRQELWGIVRTLVQQGISVICSTSYLNEAEVCDRVILLYKGSSLYDGSPTQLKERVSNRVFRISGMQTAPSVLLSQLFASGTILDGTIYGDSIRILAKSPSISIPEALHIQSVPPTFEDAFLSMLETPASTFAHFQVTKEYPTDGWAIEANGLCKVFGSFTAVNSVTFQVKSGEIFGLLGPNGAGKSTCFKMLCGLIKPTSGSAKIHGVNMSCYPTQARAQIGYMAQKFSLYGNLTLAQNLSFFAGIYNLRGREKKRAIDEVIEILKFEKYLHKVTDSLPLGIKQRLALACAMMHQPSVLFLDEPTSSVDTVIRRELWHHIHHLVAQGMTVLISTHLMDEAEYCDRIVLIHKSKVIAEGSPEELKRLAISSSNSSPTLEDSFIHIVGSYGSGT